MNLIIAFFGYIEQQRGIVGQKEGSVDFYLKVAFQHSTSFNKYDD
jgi:hypothetical protein